jgi:hypothetical protein
MPSLAELLGLVKKKGQLEEVALGKRLRDSVNAQMPAPRPVPPKRTPSQGVRG